MIVEISVRYGAELPPGNVLTIRVSNIWTIEYMGRAWCRWWIYDVHPYLPDRPVRYSGWVEQDL